jgi:hypothetical protein
MNPALGIIIVIICVAVWFIAYKLYKPIGKIIGKIGHSAIDTMKDKNNSESEEKDNGKE